MLQWVDENCSKTSFILKVDDDVSLNVNKLIQFIDENQANKRIIYGKLAVNWIPNRSPDSKYYISYEHFKPDFFPYFITGPAYLMTSDCVADLYAKALGSTFIPKLEDVFVTGVVAQEVNIARVGVTEFLNDKKVKNSISIHSIMPSEQAFFWNEQRSTDNLIILNPPQIL